MTTNDNSIDNGSDDNDNNHQNGNPLPLEASREELLHCQLSSWFPTFSQLPPDHEYRRSNVTIKSQIIAPLPPDFTDFLLEDGIRLPQGATKLSSCAPYEAWQQNDDDDSDDQNDDKDNNESDHDESQQRQFSFPQLNQQLQEAITALGGSVMPKLNWSAPKDATWVNEGTLKCKTPGDVYLLLKSSDFCLHDWQVFQEKMLLKAQSQSLSGNDNMDENAAKEQQQEEQEEPRLELVLRKWCNFYPSMEFRCFVRNHILIGISQRNHSQHYPHLLHDKERIQSLILEFFEDVVCHRFANNQLANYVFDVYIDRSDRVWLVDFNVWSIQTDALLCTWEELVDLRVPVDVYDGHDDDFPVVRVVETALEVRQDPLSSYRAPMDTVTLASSSNAVGCGGGGGGGSGPTSFESFMAMCQKPSERTDCDESSTGSDDGDGGGGQQQEQTRG